MGVPKFYRWISERYPKINQIVSDNALLPEVDHLYLDLNGIIHGCTHPSDRDVADGLSEREMMLGIMHYLDRIITIARPKQSIYMAIDGVAPRAKLNQQRSRRFRSAKDMAEATKDIDKKDQHNVFDSNCITPGTEFLEKVSDIMKYFIRKKLKEDPLWHGRFVIFSGHDIPGEGEHKIMQHIREMRASPNYQPNTRHCIYGQDADLIMLGLVTHEPHFCILREIVDFSFGGGPQKNTLKAVKKFTKESDFQLLHLSVLREYLQLEFCSEPQYDLERSIDDFVFITFLVGNDFLPHMPTLDIGDGAFDLLFDIYRDQRQGWGDGQYLTESGRICDPERLEAFLAAIGAVETDILTQRELDDAAYLKKKRRWDKRDGREAGPSDAELAAQESSKQADYMTMIETLLANQSLKDDDYVDGWTPVTEAGQKDYKGRYYYEKMKLTPIMKHEHWKLRKAYMEGLMWCLAYYYEGCISWGWFYPYHYGPMLSDLTNLTKMFGEISFEAGEPLTPFQQLMGCLPPASAILVPKPYRWLMTSPQSPIIRFYPENFEVDMNGKKNPWEGVNLLPFIDVKLLKDTIAEHCPPSKLSIAEQRRNDFGKVFCYRYDPTCNDTVSSPNPKIGIPDIVGSHSSVSVIDHQESTGTPFKPVLVPGTQIPYPGFPSLRVLPMASVELVKIGLNCFGSPSKYPTMLLTMHQMPEMPPLEVLADNVLGKSLFINWPMMHEGRVVAISNEEKEIRLHKGNQRKVTTFDETASDRWFADSEAMTQLYHLGNGIPGSGGVDIGPIKIRLKLVPLQGMKTNPVNGSTKKLFGKQEADVPLQLCLWQAPAPDPRFIERGPMTLKDRFPESSRVVLTKGKYRGCKGTVVGIADQKSVGVKVETIPPEVPFGVAIARSIQESYISSIDAARILKMHPGLFGKVTGRLPFEQGRYDLGLNLKSADGSCVVGYTRRKIENSGKSNSGEKANVWAAGDTLFVIGSIRMGDTDDDNDERMKWEYSPRAIRLVEAYRQKFPQLFLEIKKAPNEKKYDANKVFGPKGEAWLPIIREWLDNVESAKLPRSPVTSESMSYEAIAAVQKAADVRNLALRKKGFPKESLVKIPGSALYRECSTGATDVLLASDLNNNEAPVLGDRVVNLCADGIPFGARGTVVAIHEASTNGTVEVVMDEEFLGGTSLQGACANFRGKLCLWAHLLKVAPENSEKLVDKLVPRGSGRAAVDRIISNIERQVQPSTGGQQSAQSAPAGAQPAAVRSPPPQAIPVVTPVSYSSAVAGRKAEVVSAQQSKTATKIADSQAPSQPKTARSSSRAGSTDRHGSKGRGRQGAWREAKGPTDGKGGGFSVRKGKSGLNRWKAVIQANAAASTSVAKAKEVNPKTAPAISAENQSSEGPALAELKSLLGVGVQTAKAAPAPATASPPPAHEANTDATLGAEANLKAMLGVTSIPAATNTSAPPVPMTEAPQPPASAAEKLLMMMSNKQSQFLPQGSYPNVRSGFNFSYVEEGKEPPPPPPAPHQHHGIQPHMFPPPPQPPYHFGVPPPGPRMPPPPHHMFAPPPFPPHMYPHGFPPPPPPPHHHQQQHQHPESSAPNGPSLKEFPPLGAEAPKAEPEPVAVTVPAPTPMAQAPLVPSVVAGKARP